MKCGPFVRGFLILSLCVLLLTATEAAPRLEASASTGQSNLGGQSYPSSSWALGVVVPEGAALQGGARLRWEGVRNVTAFLTLPNISMPDKIVYAVVSIMTSNGDVLQAAAGVRPNDSGWLAYSWMIPSVGSVPLVYRWIVNASEPELAPGSSLAISIFHNSSGWNLRILNQGTGVSIARAYPSGLGDTVEVGDQEVFSLESYSKSSATFRDMGNLTLTSLLMNGVKVTGGVYSYSEWDPSHDPLFVVGSSGSSPPTFISFGQANDGSFVWGYARVWASSGDSLTGIEMTLAAVMIFIVPVIVAALWKTRRPQHVLASSENRMVD